MWWLIVGCLVVWIVTSSCVTNGYLGESGREAIRTVTRLEEQLSSIDRRLEEVTERAEDLEGNLRVFEQQFRIYVDGVREMRAIIREYETKVERATESQQATYSNTD